MRSDVHNNGAGHQLQGSERYFLFPVFGSAVRSERPYPKQMRPGIEVISDVSFQRPSQMPFSEDDHMIQTLSANAADEAFRERILPRTPCCRDHFLNAHSLNPSSKIGYRILRHGL